ncbi:leishmanolysin-related zinc metalloendopeptidase [Palleronia caenipelagi]|uniref:leishmanolysin-related zinc metalloendopeptidase n=1 Tax=Palleronia caenipelagi TaxID=2489174 RepID=UPI00163DA93A|nr:leishmanolysin-related zinc metalloendopeptidase [Palleronia caenipelagi]
MERADRWSEERRLELSRDGADTVDFDLREGVDPTAPGTFDFSPELPDTAQEARSDGLTALPFNGTFDARPERTDAKGGGARGGKKQKDPGGDTTGSGDGGTGSPGDGLLTTYTSGGDASNYNVTVQFNGSNWTAALQEDFVAAADYLSSIILGDVADVFVSGFGAVDDILITADLIEIDGAGGTLGRAGPTSYRTSDYLPATGLMEFDVADAENFDARGLFDDIVLHEMIHALGFGTMWGLMDLVTGVNGDLRFRGELATAAYNEDFADIASTDILALYGVPVETDYGSGTAGGHWDEATFDNELMTGIINSENYLSDMSIAALEDMGYDTVIDNPNDPTDLWGDLMAA